jgi:maltose/moltooligosaccharide transporter
MSFGFFGIQFGFALQNANTSRIFSTLGANPDDLSLFWLAAPVTGLLVQPIIGYLSDNTWHPTWGRRRPFFFVGAVLASIALFLMPNSSALWMAVAVLWLMDGAINVSMEPFRAFVGDKLGPSQQTAGFAMQTFFIGWGAVIASLLPTIFADLLGVSNVPVGGASRHRALLLLLRRRDLHGCRDVDRADRAGTAARRTWKPSAPSSAAARAWAMRSKRSWAASAKCRRPWCSWRPCSSSPGSRCLRCGSTPPTPSAKMCSAPPTRNRRPSRKRATASGVMFAVYSGVSALAAFILPIFARHTSRKFVHMSCLVIGGVSLFSIYAIHDINMLYLPMIGVGIAWASILTMPYAILAGALPAKRMGYYMGVFNFFIVIPQIVSGLLLGFVTKHWFAGHASRR